MPLFQTEYHDLCIAEWFEQDARPGYFRYVLRFRAQYWEAGKAEAKFGPTVDSEKAARESVQHLFPVRR